MIRTLFGIGAALAIAGAANAQTMSVSVTGKTNDTVKVELWRAARTVCAQVADPFSRVYDTDCESTTFDHAYGEFKQRQRGGAQRQFVSQNFASTRSN